MINEKSKALALIILLAYQLLHNLKQSLLQTKRQKVFTLVQSLESDPLIRECQAAEARNLQSEGVSQDDWRLRFYRLAIDLLLEASTLQICEENKSTAYSQLLYTLAKMIPTSAENVNIIVYVDEQITDLEECLQVTNKQV